MATEKQYARATQAFEWLACGHRVEMKWAEGPWENFPADLTPAGAFEIVRGNDEVQFRIKPHTVKIGSREVEAPVLEPVEGQTVWYWDSVHWKPVASGGRHEDWAQDGWYFAGPEACRAAHEAWAALMRGEA